MNRLHPFEILRRLTRVGRGDLLCGLPAVRLADGRHSHHSHRTHRSDHDRVEHNRVLVCRILLNEMQHHTCQYFASFLTRRAEFVRATYEVSECVSERREERRHAVPSLRSVCSHVTE
jgi:hypothetical protein